MKKFIILISVVILLLQFGCTKSVRYTEEEIRDFSTDIQEKIRKGEISLGMSIHQVRYSWGSPDSTKILEPFEGKPLEEWIYSVPGTLGIINTKILLFLDGKLMYIK
ncbi:MAG: hypothetical protein AB1610_06885 [Nitrospirota bacterium]